MKEKKSKFSEMEQWINGQTEEGTNRQMDQQTDGQMDKWKKRHMDTQTANLPILQDFVPYRDRCPIKL